MCAARYQRPKIVTASSIEKSIRQQREIESQQRQLEAFSVESAKLLSVAHCQSRVDARRQQVLNETTRSGKLIHDKAFEEEKNKRIHDRTIAQNNAITAQQEREYLEDERQRVEIQRICEESPELKELEKALKIAYLNKDRAIQQEEKMLLAQREKERILAMEQEMEYNRITAIQADQEKMDAQKNGFVEQRRILQAQIDERKQLVIQAQRQADIDRQMVDSIVNQINQEDEADFRRKKEMQEKSAQMIRDFERQRQIEKAMAIQQEREDEEKILAYNQYLESRNEGVLAKKQAKKEDEDRILQKIIEQTERKRREEEEYNNLRDLLWEEELEKKRQQEVIDRKVKQEQGKRDMFEMNNRLLKSKQQIRAQELEREARLIEVMKSKFLQDEAKEKEEEYSRQVAKISHKKSLERQLDDKRFLTEQERMNEMKILEESKRQEEYRKRVIQEARKRLLEEHAAKLQGYLPPGTMQKSNYS